MPHLFISYSSKDRAQAEALESLLADSGHIVWRDKTRLEADWSQEIAFGLAGAEALCLIWSANAAESKWVSHEWLTARALEKRIFVLFLDDTPLPEPLSTIDGDFTLSALLNRIQRTSAFHFRYDFTAAAAPVFIPFRPNPDFRGRRADLLELYLAMIGNLKRTGINQVGTVGAGGIGKTQLAVEFAWRFSFAFAGIYWIQAADERLWEQQFLEIARDRLGIEIEDPSGSNARREYLLALQEYCRRKANILFILDNVPEPKHLNSASALDGPPPLDLGASILFTTRRRFDLPAVSQHSVGILSPATAKELLTSSRPATTPAEDEAVDGICNAAGYLPLALVLISGLLRKRPRVTYAAYRAELQKKRLGSIDLGQISEAELATRHLASVEDTLADQWKALKDTQGRRLFRLLGFFPEAAIVPKVRLGLLAGLEFSDTLADPLQDAFNELRDLHLLEELEDGAAVRLHPLVRDFAARLTPSAKEQKSKSDAAVKLARIYLEPMFLKRQVSSRGIDSVIEDFAIAFSWNADLPEDARHLYRILERERLQLGRPEASLFRQLQHRAANLNLTRLSQLYAGVESFLRTSFVSRQEDLGWIRSFPCDNEEVSTLAISPDGRTAVGGWIKLFQWDCASGRILRKQKQMLFSSVAITVDSRYAICANDRYLLCWDLHNGNEVWRVKKHEHEITAVALSPDSRFAVTGDDQGSTLLWDIEGREVIRRFSTVEGEVRALAFHPSGRSFLRASSSGVIHLFETTNAKPVREFVPDPPAVACIAFALNGDHFASGTNKGDLILWNTASAAPLHIFTRLHRHINSLAVSPDGGFAVTADNDMSLILWNLKEREAERRFLGHTAEVDSVAISPDGRTALSGSEDKTLILWDLSSPQPLHGESHWNRVGAIVFSQDGSRALSGAADGTLILWDAVNKRCLRKFDSGSKDIAGAAISSDLRYALSGDREGVITLWDLTSFEPISRFEDLGGASEYPSFTFGHPCALLSEKGKLTLKALDTGKPLRLLQYEDEDFDRFSFLSDGQRALSSHGWGGVTLWDLNSAQPLHHWKDLTASFYRGTLIQGDSRLATVDGDSIDLWDLDSGKLCERLYTSSDLIALDAHGSTLAVGDYHGVVHFLEV